jgi:hypothetical protein
MNVYVALNLVSFSKHSFCFSFLIVRAESQRRHLATFVENLANTGMQNKALEGSL